MTPRRATARADNPADRAWTALLATLAFAAAPAAVSGQGTTLAVSQVSEVAGGDAIVAIRIVTSDLISAFGMDLSFDAAKITFLSLSTEETLSAAWAMLDSNLVTPGRLRIGGARGQRPPITGSGTLLNLAFRLHPTTTQSVALTLGSLKDDFVGARTIPGSLTGRIPDPAVFVGPGSGTPGGQVQVPVGVIDAVGFDAVGLQIVYDPSRLSFVSLSRAGTLTEDWFLFGGNEAAPGRLALGGLSHTGTPARGRGPLANLTFGIRASAAPGVVTLRPIQLSDDLADAIAAAGSIFIVADVPAATAIGRAEYVLDAMAEGKLLYGDRSFQFVDPIPSGFTGQPYIRTLHGDRNAAGAAFLSFHIPRESMIVVALDASIDSLPAWLATWTEREEVLLTTDANPSRRLLARVMPAGEVTLGANGRDDALEDDRSMYTVLIFPAGGPPPPRSGTRRWQVYE